MLIFFLALSTRAHPAEAVGPGYIFVQGLPKPSAEKDAYSIYLSDLRYGGFRLVNQDPIASGDYCIGGLVAGKNYRLKVSKGQASDAGASHPFRTWQENALAGSCAGDAKGPPELKPRELLYGITLTTAALVNAPRKHELIFGYGKLGPKSIFGTDWEAAGDGGACGTYFSIPKPGQPPLNSWSCVRIAGFLGASQWDSKSCKIVSYAVADLHFAKKWGSVNLAKADFPRKGLRLLLRLGPGHAIGRQNYGVYVQRYSISQDMTNYKGNGYGTLIKGERLSPDEWREVKIDFPAEGATVRQPASTFAQNEWISADMYRPWGTDDLTHLDIVAAVHDAHFDLLVGGVAFY